MLGTISRLSIALVCAASLTGAALAQSAATPPPNAFVLTSPVHKDGAFLDKKPTEKDRVPVRPFVGDLVKRGDDMKNYVPSLDPVRVPGKVLAPK